MPTTHLLAQLDTALLLVPIFAFLACWMFSLDERVATPRDRSTRRHFCQADARASYLCDPDGQPFHFRGPVTPPPPLTPGSAQSQPL